MKRIYAEAVSGRADVDFVLLDGVDVIARSTAAESEDSDSDTDLAISGLYYADFSSLSPGAYRVRVIDNALNRVLASWWVRVGSVETSYFSYETLQPAETSNQVGPGSSTVTITISDNGVPVEDCEVWISSDSGGTNVIAGTLLTDSSGEVVFLLDDGATYYLWAEKSGMTPITGRAFIAEADT